MSLGGIMAHKLTNIDSKNKTANCEECGVDIPIRNSGNKKKDGTIFWRCKISYEAGKLAAERPYVFFKGDVCEQCGFVPEHSCQLGVDHIDGNRKNNHHSNLMTLCHNCHSLKTHTKNDYLNRYETSF
jgi:hypothetical protein